jgi:hypothetical protein
MVLAYLVDLDGQDREREPVDNLEKPSSPYHLGLLIKSHLGKFRGGTSLLGGSTSWLRNIKPTSDRWPRIGRVYEICLCVHCAPIQWSRRKRPHYKRTVTSATSGAATRVGTGSSRTPPFGLIGNLLSAKKDVLDRTYHPLLRSYDTTEALSLRAE